MAATVRVAYDSGGGGWLPRYPIPSMCIFDLRNAHAQGQRKWAWSTIFACYGNTQLRVTVWLVYYHLTFHVVISISWTYPIIALAQLLPSWTPYLFQLDMPQGGDTA